MIDTAMQLFHQQGIHATSVDEILEKSGTGKGQFYHYFKNKEGLIHSVLITFYDRLRSPNSPMSNPIETWNDLENWFRRFLEFQKSVQFTRSCPVGTIGTDLSREQELLRQDVRLIFEHTKRSLADFFSLMKGRGELPADADPEGLSDFCFTIMQGGLLVSKIKREAAPFENSITHAMNYLRSLQGRRRTR
jgi:TetR/AcrR family transcriptional regulator, transcriptional repressor for nem operon